MSITPPHEWGLQSDITPRFGARLVQEGNRLYYLADRAGLTGSFSPMHLQKIDIRRQLPWPVRVNYSGRL